MPISDQLRKAIAASGETHYRLMKETGVDSRAIDRFMYNGTDLRTNTVDLLCEYLSLELRPKKQRKRTRKSTETATKQRQKKTQ